MVSKFHLLLHYYYIPSTIVIELKTHVTRFLFFSLIIQIKYKQEILALIIGITMQWGTR